MQYRNLTGSLLTPDGENIRSGELRFYPIAVMPVDGDQTVFPQPGFAAIANSAIVTGAQIMSGVNYRFELWAEINGQETRLDQFNAGVPDVAGNVSYAELYALANLYVPVENPGGGSGDMLKSVYDPNNDGKVNSAVQADSATTAATATTATTATTALAVDWPNVTNKPATFTPAAHTHAIADITGLTAALATKADLVGGVIPTSQLPAIAINDVFPVADQAAMLALTAQRGDVAKRADLPIGSRMFILAADDPTQLANWIQFEDGNGNVESVNGQTGIVILGAADVDAAPDTIVPVVDGHTTDIADHETRITTLEGSGGISAYESEEFRIKAALLEPGILRAHYGREKYVVPANETHYHQFSWNLRRDSVNGPARFENRDATGGPVPMRDIAFYGQQLTSFGWWFNPTGVTYADAKEEYYKKIGMIKSRPTRVWHNVGNEAGVTWKHVKPGPFGSVVLVTGGFDVAWFAWGEELGDEAGGATLPEPHANVHQETRFTDSFLTNPVVFSADTANSAGTGRGFNWGFRISGVDTPEYVPQNWFYFVNVPAEFRTVDKDAAAPAGFKYSINTVSNYILPANIVATGSGLAIEDESEWLYVAAGSGWYGTETTAPIAGEAFCVEYFHEFTNGVALFGFGQNTGTAEADFTHAFKINGNTLSVIHNAGAGQVSRTFAQFTLEQYSMIRFRATVQADGKAYYEFQTTQQIAGALPHPIGGSTWYDALEGTEPASGTGFTNLRMKGSATTAAHTLARPRIAHTHAAATNKRGSLMRDTFAGMPPITGYPSLFAFLHGRVPDKAQVGTNVWQSAGTQWKLFEHGTAYNSAGSAGEAIKYDAGIADIDITLNVKVSTYLGWGMLLRFNVNSASMDDALNWYVATGPDKWIMLGTENLGGGTYAFHKGADGQDWDGTNAVGAGDHVFRVRALDNNIKVWCDDVLIHDVTIANRPYKSQTAIAIRPWDDAGETLANRGKWYEVDILRSV